MKKPLLCLLILLFCCGSASAQTLKWTHTLAPTTTFEQDNASIHCMQVDALGNTGIVIRYNHLGSYAGMRVLWLTGRGKVIHTVEIPASSGFNAAAVCHLSATSLLIVLEGDSSKVMRHYRARGKSVITSDSVLGTDEFVLSQQLAISNDRTGFFVCTQDSNGSLASFKRFTMLKAD